jgi:hypothetical protein
MPSSGMYRLHHQEDKNRRARKNVRSFFFAACFGCWILLTLILARPFLLPWWWRRYVPSICRLLQEPQGITSKKAVFFIMVQFNIKFQHRLQRLSHPVPIDSNPHSETSPCKEQRRLSLRRPLGSVRFRFWQQNLPVFLFPRPTP